ncbi:MAG: hemerythrin domain-containing protein [Nitrospinae bacterium]|nr:hemerythrin domain-containing protein [Nitrospinota bacterium]
MKRSQELIRFSREHHPALVLARRVKLNAPGGGVFKRLAGEFPAKWKKEIAPHFAEEERSILPRLVAAGATELAERLQRDHAELRRLSTQAMGGDAAALKEFGKLIYDHIRFEERVLFPYYEKLTGLF